MYKGRHDAKGRSLRTVDRFVSLPNYLLASVAVRTLLPSEFEVLIYLAMRCYGAKNNGRIVFANRSGCLWFNTESRRSQEYPIGTRTGTGLAKSTVGAALRELERRGLIVCTKRSSFDQKRLAKEWRLTWVKTAEGSPTNEFLSFKPDGEKAKRRPTGRPKDSGIGRYTGSTTPSNETDGVLQTDTPAYRERHRPIHGPRCNHVIESDEIALTMVKISKAVNAESGG